MITFAALTERCPAMHRSRGECHCILLVAGELRVAHDACVLRYSGRGHRYIIAVGTGRIQALQAGDVMNAVAPNVSEGSLLRRQNKIITFGAEQQSSAGYPAPVRSQCHWVAPALAVTFPSRTTPGLDGQCMDCHAGRCLDGTTRASQAGKKKVTPERPTSVRAARSYCLLHNQAITFGLLANKT